MLKHLTNRPNFGDNIGSVSGGNRLIPVWHDTSEDFPAVIEPESPDRRRTGTK
jgi:hypothetical protein